MRREWIAEARRRAMPRRNVSEANRCRGRAYVSGMQPPAGQPRASFARAKNGCIRFEIAPSPAIIGQISGINGVRFRLLERFARAKTLEIPASEPAATRPKRNRRAAILMNRPNY